MMKQSHFIRLSGDTARGEKASQTRLAQGWLHMHTRSSHDALSW